MRARLGAIALGVFAAGAMIVSSPAAMASTAQTSHETGATVVAAAQTLRPASGNIEQQLVQSASTTNNQGNLSGSLADTYNTSTDFIWQGTVCGGTCGAWPFADGSGLNTQFNGHQVYVVYQHGTGNCWQISGSNVVFQSGVCGGTHWYSFWVFANAPDGAGSTYGFVDVGQSNASGKAEYMRTPGSGRIDQWAPLVSGSDAESYTPRFESNETAVPNGTAVSGSDWVRSSAACEVTLCQC
jgi:hypothetical protein